jgi:hypothetical protein
MIINEIKDIKNTIKKLNELSEAAPGTGAGGPGGRYASKDDDTDDKQNFVTDWFKDHPGATQADFIDDYIENRHDWPVHMNTAFALAYSSEAINARDSVTTPLDPDNPSGTYPLGKGPQAPMGDRGDAMPDVGGPYPDKPEPIFTKSPKYYGPEDADNPTYGSYTDDDYDPETGELLSEPLKVFGKAPTPTGRDNTSADEYSGGGPIKSSDGWSAEQQAAMAKKQRERQKEREGGGGDDR